jgi:hypothetical protein
VKAAEDDICTVTHQNSDAEKYKLLTTSQKVEKDFSFPQHQFGIKSDGKPHMRAFSLKWLEEFGQDGLCYSVFEDAAYCKFCRLFPGGERGLLVEKPFRKWKDALREFNAHFRNVLSDKTKGCKGNKLHLSAVTRAAAFIRVFQGQSVAVDQALSDHSKTQVLNNRKVLKSIGQTIHHLGKQGLPLRGHRDDSKYSEKQVNRGNFQELLEFRCEAGDSTLQLHFDTCHKNATYRSKTVQNQLIDISNQILDSIVADVKEAKFFAVAADEATDRSLQTQLTTTLRFVNKKGDVVEDFIGFTNITGDTTGQNIADVLIEKIESLDLNMSDVRGQGYDGTGKLISFV